MFGRGDKVFCDLLLQGRYPFMVGDGRNMLDFVHVDDVAAGHLAAEGTVHIV
jgi:nucleoside-diphosphate-sugar epimerase